MASNLPRNPLRELQSNLRNAPCLEEDASVNTVVDALEDTSRRTSSYKLRDTQRLTARTRDLNARGLFSHATLRSKTGDPRGSAHPTVSNRRPRHRWLVITGQISGLLSVARGFGSRGREPGIGHRGSFHFGRLGNNAGRSGKVPGKWRVSACSVKGQRIVGGDGSRIAEKERGREGRRG